ncbi:MAG: Dihydropteroate synthase [Herbinix sp.]|jgi:dihydropteroate synthase|nr:Dihydropteroate synthase [Herbinix sp.]
MIQTMRIGKKDFPLGEKTYIMGILNVTPDSFSDGGKHNHLEEALEHAHQMIEEGADIIDIGGESTRPNYTKISDEEEIARVVPIIETIKKNWDIPISIDTYKSKVANAACKAGADLVNDIWGLKHDPEMAGIVKGANAAVCLMHNRQQVYYQNFLEEFMTDMRECVDIALKAGITKDKIILDPGVGFAKTYEMNLSIIHHLNVLNELGLPVLLGTSRKSVIGLTLDLPVDKRVEGTIATSVIAVMKGCHFLRVHDVKENLRAVRMAEAILRSESLLPIGKPCQQFPTD